MDKKSEIKALRERVAELQAKLENYNPAHGHTFRADYYGGNLEKRYRNRWLTAKGRAKKHNTSVEVLAREYGVPEEYILKYSQEEKEAVSKPRKEQSPEKDKAVKVKPSKMVTETAKKAVKK